MVKVYMNIPFVTGWLQSFGMVGDIILLVIGIAALFLGGELTVRYAVRLAEAFKVPTLIVGLTIVAIGSSLPELAVGIEGVRYGNGPIVMGNIVGTNIVNILLILGLSALIRAIPVPEGVVRFDLPIMIGTGALLMALSALGHQLSRWNGLILLLVGIIYLIAVVLTARRRPTPIEVDHDLPPIGMADEAHGMRMSHPDEVAAAPRPTAKHILLTLLMLAVGLLIIMIGANWMLDGAIGVAENLGVSQTMIGLTIVAIGTSAPELVTMIVATIRDERGLAFGTLIGSSIINVTLILGTSLLFAAQPIPVAPSFMRIDIPIMILVSLACVPVFLTGKRMSRLEGGLFVAAYLGYLAYTISAAF